MTKLVSLLQRAGLIMVLLFAAGFGIETLVTIPDYAVVYLDDAANTYIALPCFEEWRTRLGDAFVRRGKVSDAKKLHYRLDDNCREAGGYIDDGRSLSGLLLVKLGILPPKQHWWDRPYRTEEGLVRPKS